MKSANTIAALAALALSATGARAAGFDEGNRTFNTVAAANIGNYVTPQQYGCVANGAADCSAAINSCLAANLNCYLSAGTYLVTHPITVGTSTLPCANCGQELYGDGRGETTIEVTQAFIPDSGCSQTASPQTCGVIYLKGLEQNSPYIHDLTINLAIGAGIASRSSFANMGSCTSGAGCKYPWAIYSQSSNRFRVERVSVYGAWDGIGTAATGAAGGTWLDNIEMGALDIGLEISAAKDFCHVSNWHSWGFGMAGTTLTNVYLDGNTEAFVLNECDGINIQDFDTESGNIIVQSSNTYAQFSNVGLDTGAQFNVTACGNCKVANIYADGAPKNGQANIEITGGTTAIINMHCAIANATCIDASGATTVLEVNSSFFYFDGPAGGGATTASLVTAENSAQLSIMNSEFKPGSSGGFGVPIIDIANTAFLRFSGNRFNLLPSGSATAVLITTDNAFNQVSNNNFQNWSFAAPGNLGFYGNNSIPSAYVDYSGGTPLPVSSTSSCEMFGYGSGAHITPVTGSGRVQFQVSGSVYNDTASDGLYIQMYYGTGTAPSYGGAASGTPIGTRIIAQNPTGAAGFRAPFTTQAIVTGLTPGTTYWFDECVEALGGGNAYLTSPTFTAREF